MSFDHTFAIVSHINLFSNFPIVTGFMVKNKSSLFFLENYASCRVINLVKKLILVHSALRSPSNICLVQKSLQREQ